MNAKIIPAVATLTEKLALMKNAYKFMESYEFGCKRFFEGANHLDNKFKS